MKKSNLYNCELVGCPFYHEAFLKTKNSNAIDIEALHVPDNLLDPSQITKQTIAYVRISWPLR